MNSRYTRKISFLISEGISTELKYETAKEDMVCPVCNASHGMLTLNDPKVDLKLAWFCLDESCMISCSEKSKKIAYEKWQKAHETFRIESEKIMAQKEKDNSNEKRVNMRSWYDD